MANRYITGSTASGTWLSATGGNFSWDFFPTSGYPKSDDVVYANGKTVTIDSGITVSLLTTSVGVAATGGTITAGGVFQITSNSGITITTNISAGTTACLATSHADGVATIIGNISAGTAANANGVTHSGLGRLNVIGNIFGGGVGNTTGVNLSNANGVNLSGCTSLYITGNTTGGSNVTNASAVLVQTTTVAYIDINGNMIAGTSYPSVRCDNFRSLVVLRGNMVATTGITPYYGFYIKCDPISAQTITFQDTSVSSANTTFSTNTYYSGVPLTSDVRVGVKYGYLSGLTGTMVIPPFSAVSVGISVDDGTGTGGVNYGTAITGIRDIGNMLAGYLG